MRRALIELCGVTKRYGEGEQGAVEVLRGIDLRIEAGEFVALVGVSGSGKSTLMHVLGGLDSPTTGTYHFDGHDIATLDPEQLSQLRRDVFGFVFQGYFLIPGISACENVELPGTYAGVAKDPRAERALQLLEQLGMAQRARYLPGQLSGGQQQRVSIARALMNGGSVLFADEPTGALDSANGEVVLQLLEGLATEGRTVILITHSPEVARRARRVIEIRDGLIISDQIQSPSPLATAGVIAPNGDIRADLSTLIRHAWLALWIAPLRSALTLLSIIIGIASVLVMLGVGEGSRQEVSKRLAGLGATLLTVYPQSMDERIPAGKLSAADIVAIGQLPSVIAAVPEMIGRSTARQGAISLQASVIATSFRALDVNNWTLRSGTFITDLHERLRMPVVVLGAQVAQTLFTSGEAIGRYVLLDNVPFMVVGVLNLQGGSSFSGNIDQSVLVPLVAGGLRLIGRETVDSVTVKVRSAEMARSAEKELTTMLRERHQRQDFSVFNRAAILQAQEATVDVMTTLFGSIAAISLLVGGIGVMNVMLMAVTERTREIGIRMAVGARPRDIQLQFLSEAIMLTFLGGLAGLVAGFGVAQLLQALGKQVHIGILPTILAISSATLTGLIFGYLPASKAARLDPVKALNKE